MTGLRSTGRFFIIVGAMKAGTTSVFRWLATVPGVALPPVKEPNFFSDDDRWSRGLSWYEALFDKVPDGHVTGEASTSYVDPLFAPRAAGRIAETLPEVRILLLVRNPFDRARSHYRHEVQRNRERRFFSAAIRDPLNPYLRRSLYFAGLESYVRTMDRSLLTIVRTEDLSAPGHPGWKEVLSTLGLPEVVPGGIENPTAPKAQFTPISRLLWDAGFLQSIDKRTPRMLRRFGRSLALRRGNRYETLLASVDKPLPRSVTEKILEDVRRLEDWLGVAPLWPDITLD